MSKSSFSAVEVKRFVNTAKDLGFPVEKMGLFVDGTRIALLPPDTSAASSLVEGGANPLDRMIGAR